jgi:hypothetical protein
MTMDVRSKQQTPKKSIRKRSADRTAVLLVGDTVVSGRRGKSPAILKHLRGGKTRSK